MRARVRSGYAFHRITKYTNRDGSIRKEKITDIIPGPAEIEASPEELEGQRHKVELLTDERTHDALSGGEEDTFNGEDDANHSTEETNAPEGKLTRNRCTHCGREVEAVIDSKDHYYCGVTCKVEAQHEALSNDEAGTAPSIVDVLDDEKLFAQAFPTTEDWRAWRVLLKSLFALPMSEEDAEVFARHTGREMLPVEPAREAWLVVGRRGGKSRIAALIGVYAACFRSYKLAPGERGVVMLLAADRAQARVLLRYVNGLFDSSPLLASMVSERLKERISLTNGIDIEIHTSSYKSVRGYTIVAAICDEIAFWKDETSANADVEVIGAIRPALASQPGSLLVCISSPYARRGALWEAHQAHHGRDGDPVLVWQANSVSMNPSIPRHVIESAYAQDEAAAAAEWGAEFRRDVESFVPLEVIEACTIPGRREVPQIARVSYFAFVDPSGGSSDSMTLGIAHIEGERVVLDCVRERKPPFSPDEVVREFAATLKSYLISSVVGDRYAGEWPRERFRVHGIRYEPSAKTKSDLYAELLPLLNGQRVELLDLPRLAAQLLGLERRTSRGGRDSIDHAPGRHDDLVNSAAGAVVLAASKAAVPTPRYWRPGAKRDVWTRLT